MLDAGLVYPLWNHRQPDSLLERVIGEVGVDHVTIPAVTGPVEQFRVFHDRENPYFHTEGGWHFPPQAKLYATSGLKPVVAKWTERKDWLTPVVELAKRAGVRVVFRINICDVAAVAEQLPAAHVSAWGQQPPQSPACISQASVREMLAATVSDLQRFEPAGFEFEGLRTDETSGGWQFRFAYFSGTQVCFCASCRATAAASGLDPDAAARVVRTSVESAVREPQAIGGVVSQLDDPVLRDYCASRESEIGAWIDRIAAESGAESVRLASKEWHGAPTHLVFRPGAWQAATRLLCAIHGLPDHILLKYVRQFGEPPGLRVNFGAGVDGVNGATLVRQMTEHAQSGANYFSFEKPEEAPEEVVTWMKQAVRYARRG
ncbi:hypothetical protein RAS1_01320 [Phycisphaerae bacterium RAS1]|nr:hypothetical protein RAS1_01320 [Phycisphaerae bacterium RAS1]